MANSDRKDVEAFALKPVLRCSSLDTILLCPGSLTLTPLVAARSGKEAVEGSALHQIAHARMASELAASGDPGSPIECSATKFSRWIADFYYRFVTETAPRDWYMEVEAALCYEFERFDLSGHIDCFAMSPDGTEAIGFDLKTGFIPVDPAENNEQVFGYACLLLRAYPTLTKITFYIVQPRNDEDEGFARISPPMVLEGDVLACALETLERRVNAALDNALEVNSGRVQCRWCPAAVQCPATKAERDLMKIKLTSDQIAAIKETPDDATLADWVVSAKTISQPIEDAKALASDRIAAAGYIVASDGTQITQKVSKGAYKVLDPMALWTTLKGILPEEAMAKCAKWSMTAIKDAIAEAMGIPKTGRAPITAESVIDTRIRLHVEQGDKKQFIFS